jgi:hypothetical protein
LSCLGCTSQPSTKYFFLTAHYFISIVPFAHQAGYAVLPSRLSLIYVSICALANLVPFKNLKLFFLSQVSAHLALKGLIDPVKELEKVNKKNVLLKQQIEKLTKLVQGMKKNLFYSCLFLS